jgi:hypothetical protein
VICVGRFRPIADINRFRQEETVGALALILVAAAAAADGGHRPQGNYVQPQGQFSSALDDDSTNDHFVLVTIEDGTSGSVKTGCVEASLLLRAIHIENDLAYDTKGVNRARQLALSAAGHRFTFRKAAALSNVKYRMLDSANEDACKIIRSGHGAWRGDIGGQVVPVRQR